MPPDTPCFHQEVAGMSRFRNVGSSQTRNHKQEIRSKRIVPFMVLVSCFLFLVFSFQASAQVNPDQAADMLLNSARKAYNEKNYPFARDRFKEFLTKFGANKNA